jgi:hypothetical protein
MTLFDPNRGRIPPPNLDDRAWSDIVSQAIALIPQYAPQWTDHGPSDIGITLVELFAWLVEGLTYRLNQVPDKNYVAFLNLLGITRDPPEPARAFLTFSATPNSVAVPKGTEAQTAGSETETPIVFETDQDLLVLPINLRVALRIGKLNAGTAYWNISTALTQPPAKGREPDHCQYAIGADLSRLRCRQRPDHRLADPSVCSIAARPGDRDLALFQRDATAYGLTGARGFTRE